MSNSDGMNPNFCTTNLETLLFKTSPNISKSEKYVSENINWRAEIGKLKDEILLLLRQNAVITKEEIAGHETC